MRDAIPFAVRRGAEGTGPGDIWPAIKETL
jgi:hypothetical protein